MTQKSIILRFLALHHDWVPSWELTSVDTPFGRITHQGGRTCRKLAENGQIEKKLIGRFVYYKLPQQKTTIYAVEGINKTIKVYE